MNKLLALALVGVLVGLAVIPAAASGPPNPGSGSSDFYLMNIDGTYSSGVNVEYYGQDGVTDAGDSITLDPYGSREFTSGTLPVGDGWVGAVVLAAERELAAVTKIVWSGGDYGDGITAGAYAGVSQNDVDTSLYFPYITRLIDKRFSTLTIQNAGSTGDANIEIRYYRKDGYLQAGPISDTIGHGRSKTYDLSTPGGKVPDLPSGTTGFQGAAVITADKPIAGTVTNHWMAYSSAYEGFSGGGQYQYLPSVFRMKHPTEHDWLRHSNILVQNLSGSDADVDIDFYKTGETSPRLHLDDTIPANSSHEYNTRFGNPGLFDPSEFEPLGEDFDGAVVVHANQEVVAVCHTFWSRTNQASTYRSMPSGEMEVFVPWQPRKKVGGSWLHWGKLVVQNLSGSPASITLEYYEPSGNTPKATFYDTIAGNSADGYNTRYGSDGGAISAGDFAVLGDSFNGAVRVLSTQPVVPVVNAFQNEWSLSYNGYVPAP